MHAYVHSPRIQLNPHISLSQAKKWGQKNCLSIPKLLSHQKPIRGHTGFHECSDIWGSPYSEDIHAESHSLKSFFFLKKKSLKKEFLMMASWFHNMTKKFILFTIWLSNPCLYLWDLSLCLPRQWHKGIYLIMLVYSHLRESFTTSSVFNSPYLRIAYPPPISHCMGMLT